MKLNNNLLQYEKHSGQTSFKAPPYVYSAFVVHSIGTQQCVVVIHFLQKIVRHTVQLQLHVGRRCAHNHLQFRLITIQRTTLNKSLKITILKKNGYGYQDQTLSSDIVMPLSNPRCTSKAEMELVILTFTMGLVTTVTPPSIVLMIWTLPTFKC